MDEKEPIPKVIYMCHKELTHIKEYSKNWKRLNPEYEIKLYDDKLCEDFLLKEYSQMHYDIFKFIKDGPIKADFWRVCVIHKYGGVYVDADIEPLVPLRKFIEPDSDFVVCMSFTGIDPILLVCRKNNFVLKKCIDTYIEYYKNKLFYEYGNWSIMVVISIVFIKYVYNDNSDISININGNYTNIFLGINKALNGSEKLNDYFKNYINNFKNNTDNYLIKNNLKYQFLHSRIDAYPLNIIKLISVLRTDGLYYVYKNKRIFNERYKNYDRIQHKFIK
jgi:hypothetical protein